MVFLITSASLWAGITMMKRVDGVRWHTMGMVVGIIAPIAKSNKYPKGKSSKNNKIAEIVIRGLVHKYSKRLTYL